MFLASLRFRLGWMVLFGVVPAAVILLGTLWLEREALRESAADKAMHAARIASLNHRRAMDEAHGLLLSLGSLPAVLEGDGAACGALFAQVLAHQRRYANLGATTPEGDVFCSALPLAEPTHLGHREWVRKARETGAFVVGSYQVGVITGRPSVNVALPARDADGVVRAIVYGALDLGVVSHLVGEEIGEADATVAMLDGKGVVLAHHPEPETWVGASTEGKAVYDRMRARRSGSVTGEGIEGKGRIFGFAPLAPGTAPHGSVLAVGLPEAAAYAASDASFERGVYIVAAMGVVGLGMSWLFAEFAIVRRARKLTEAAARLATGDLAARSELPHGADELGQLARAFDEMAASLDELTRHNRLVLESTGEGILAVDADGRIRSANPAAAQLLGHAADALPGRCLHALVHGPDADHARDACPLLQRAPGAVPRDDTFLRPDGHAFPVQALSSPIHGEGGGTVVVFTDMRERRRLEDQLRQAMKMEAVGKLAGGIAHDFNNLLTAILGYGDLLRMRLGARSPLQRELAEMLRAAHRAAALTRQLLAFSRRQALAPRVVDLNGVVVGLEKMLRRLIGEDVTLDLELDASGSRILADPGQIEQVVMNLAVNAREAMPQGGRLTFRTSEVAADDGAAQGLSGGPWVVLTATDTGVGMDAGTAARIFEPFFTTKETGTGLGLSMVYGIVNQCGGHVQVDSEPGQGATFRIFFPRTDDVATADNEHTGEAPIPGRETILLVEDDVAVRGLVRRTLEETGYTVLDATDVHHAQSLAERHGGQIHLMLTDVIMPGMSGRALAAAIERRRPGLRVLYMSGYTDGELAAHGFEGVAFLPKPFTAKGLLARVREVLDVRPETQAAV